MFSEFFKKVFIGEEIFSRRTIILHLALILLSFIFVYFFSYSTSFRYLFFDGDSAIFQLVGKSWLEGSLPYKDLFDHKGPLIFLIDALGWAIYPVFGIMILQIIFMYITLLFVWRTMEFYFGGAEKILFIAFTVTYYEYCYWEGNRVDEYSLAFLAAAAYCFASYLKFSRIEKLHGFIYGLGFGACVLLRTTNSMPICCFVFLTAIFLIKARDFKNLRENFFTFCAGFAVIVLPFVIYFAANDALYDMIYGTILFNVKYAVNGSFHGETAWDLFVNSITFFPLFLMIIASTFELVVNRKNKFAWCTIFLGAMLLAMLFKLQSYEYYSMIIVPVLPLMFAVLNDACKDFWQGLKRLWQVPGFSFKRLACKFLLMILLLPVLLYTGIYLQKFAFTFSEEMVEFEENFLKRRARVEELAKIIPDDEKNSVVTWGIGGLISGWCLLADITPRQRFFCNQVPLSKLDPAIRQEWFDNVKKEYPRWILYGGKLQKKVRNISTSHADSDLEKILADKYIFQGEVDFGLQMLKLYRLKQ